MCTRRSNNKLFFFFFKKKCLQEAKKEVMKKKQKKYMGKCFKDDGGGYCLPLVVTLVIYKLVFYLFI